METDLKDTFVLCIKDFIKSSRIVSTYKLIFGIYTPIRLKKPVLTCYFHLVQRSIKRTFMLYLKNIIFRVDPNGMELYKPKYNCLGSTLREWREPEQRYKNYKFTSSFLTLLLFILNNTLVTGSLLIPQNIGCKEWLLLHWRRGNQIFTDEISMEDQ